MDYYWPQSKKMWHVRAVGHHSLMKNGQMFRASACARQQTLKPNIVLIAFSNFIDINYYFLLKNPHQMRLLHFFETLEVMQVFICEFNSIFKREFQLNAALRQCIYCSSSKIQKMAFSRTFQMLEIIMSRKISPFRVSTDV